MATLTLEARTILGPLTTTFTPPAPCSGAVGLCSTCDVAWYGQLCGPTGAADATSCWPATSRGAQAARPPIFGWGFYSPGYICPAGFTSACSATAGSLADWVPQFIMSAGETAVGCCPTGFACANINGQTCLAVASSVTVGTVTCDSGSSDGFAWATIPNAALGLESINLFAPMIEIAWKQSDLPESLRSTSTVTSVTNTASQQTTSATASTSSPTGIVAGSGGGGGTSASAGMSTGAVAGLAVGVTALVFGIAIAAFYVWRKKRRHDTSLGDGPQTLAYHDGARGPTPALAAWPASATTEGEVKYYHTGHPEKPAELHQVERFEAPGQDSQPRELPA